MCIPTLLVASLVQCYIDRAKLAIACHSTCTSNQIILSRCGLTISCQYSLIVHSSGNINCKHNSSVFGNLFQNNNSTTCYNLVLVSVSSVVLVEIATYDRSERGVGTIQIGRLVEVSS